MSCRAHTLLGGAARPLSHGGGIGADWAQPALSSHTTDPLPPGAAPTEEFTRSVVQCSFPTGVGLRAPRCRTAAMAMHWLLQGTWGLLVTPLQACDRPMKLKKVMPPTFWKFSCHACACIWDGYRRILPTPVRKWGRGKKSQSFQVSQKS